MSENELPTGLPTLINVAMPKDTNPDGDIFGGWLMSQMDLAGAVFATKEVKGRVATVAVEAMSFHKPVRVGDEVSCYSALVRIGRTSITVRVESWVQRYHGMEHEKVTEGTFTYVALDSTGKSRPITRF